MKRRGPAILMVVICGTAIAAFGIGRVVAMRQHRQGSEVRHGRMRGAPMQAPRAEGQFEVHLSQLADAVRDEQALLASVLADPCSTDRQFLACVDRLIESHELLLRIVGERLATVQARLPRAQAREFVTSCANSLEGHVQRRYRWRGGAQTDASQQAQSDDHRGRYGWGIAGQGAGRGRQYRRGQTGGHGLARRLQMTEAQIVWARQQDPDFEDDCARLKSRLREAYTALLAGLERTDASDENRLAGLDDLIEAHNSLERRVAEHVVLLRPRLSQEQLEHLAKLCQGPRPPASGDRTSTSPKNADRLKLAHLATATLGHCL